MRLSKTMGMRGRWQPSGLSTTVENFQPSIGAQFSPAADTDGVLSVTQQGGELVPERFEDGRRQGGHKTSR